MDKPLEKTTGSAAYRAVNRIVRIFSGISAIVLIIMMLLTAGDVILRYLFNTPILGSIELTEFMMAVLVFFSVAYTQIGKAHVKVDFLTDKLSPRINAVLDTISYCSILVIFGLITWRLVKYAGLIQVGNYESPTWYIPLYPFIYVAAVGAAVMFLALLFDTWGYLRQVIKDRVQWSVKAGLLLIIVLVLLIFSAPLWGSGLFEGISPYAIAIFYTCFLIAVIFIGMPVAFVMILAGFLGAVYLNGMEPSLSMIAIESYNSAKSYGNSVIPLFVLMGVFFGYAGLSGDLYTSAYKWIGRMPGGLAMATVGACAGFAAVSGSGAATAATIGAVALPEMKRFKYDPALSAGCIAAGGTLGILIPPSIPLAMYGLLTEQSIGKLFLAGFIPGIIQAVFYIITIYIMCRLKSGFGPKGPVTTFKEKIASLKGTWGVIVLFVIVIGGLYAGIFTPTEAAGAGAFVALVIALSARRLSWRSFIDSLMETVKTNGMIIFIIIGGVVFAHFLTTTRLPFELAERLAGLAVSRYVILIAIVLVYLVMGCIMSSLAMIVITVPILFPVITALGFDPIWFGIMVVRMVEIGAITPPVGMNVFVIHGIAKDIPMYTIFRGIAPFLVADFFHVVLLIAVPGVVLLLPNMMH